MFVPVSIGAGGERTTYNRRLELTVRQMTAFSEHAGNMTEPLTLIGADLRTSVAAQFATEGAGGLTGKWKQLSDNPEGHGYRSWKAAHGNPPILVGLQPLIHGTRTHPLKNAKLSPSGKMRRELLDPLALHVSPRRLLYAPVSDIAGFHESGTSKMPARPPVDLNLQNLRSIDRHFIAWIARLVERSGL